MTTKVKTVRANGRATKTSRFGWADLSSTDDAAAAAFYSRVFGWAYREMSLGDGMVHRDAEIDGLLIAGIDPVMPGSGQPSAWTNFVFVENIDTVTARATDLGATVVMEPMDVMGAGHMAVLLDTTGAAFGLWQPGTHNGADAVNQPGTYTWADLATDDVEAARTFYGELFGWTWKRAGGDDSEYWHAMVGGGSVAGVMPKPGTMSGMPNMWSAYFGVADLEEALKEIKGAGGSVLSGPMPMGPGTGAVVSDPAGGHFVAFQWNEWPAD